MLLFLSTIVIRETHKYTMRNHVEDISQYVNMIHRYFLSRNVNRLNHAFLTYVHAPIIRVQLCRMVTSFEV